MRRINATEENAGVEDMKITGILMDYDTQTVIGKYISKKLFLEVGRGKYR